LQKRSEVNPVADGATIAPVTLGDLSHLSCLKFAVFAMAQHPVLLIAVAILFTHVQHTETH
jgi:hypothetical protein